MIEWVQVTFDPSRFADAVRPTIERPTDTRMLINQDGEPERQYRWLEDGWVITDLSEMHLLILHAMKLRPHGQFDCRHIARIDHPIREAWHCGWCGLNPSAWGHWGCHSGSRPMRWVRWTSPELATRYR